MKKINQLLCLLLLSTSATLLAQERNPQNNPYTYATTGDASVLIDFSLPLTDRTSITIHADSKVVISIFDYSHTSSSFNMPYVTLKEPTEETQRFLKLVSFSSSTSWNDPTWTTQPSTYNSYLTNNYNASCMLIPVSVGKEELTFTATSSEGIAQTAIVEVTVIP